MLFLPHTRRDKIKKINEAEKKKIGKGAAPLAGKIAVCTLKDSEYYRIYSSRGRLRWWKCQAS